VRMQWVGGTREVYVLGFGPVRSGVPVDIPDDLAGREPGKDPVTGESHLGAGLLAQKRRWVRMPPQVEKGDD
jgi:hypothetical protein